MGKASSRRRMRRQQYLARIAKESPEEFRFEWAKRVHSWAIEARRRASSLRGREGRPTPAAFELVHAALTELRACGRYAFDCEAQSTADLLATECAKAVASEVDPRMFRLDMARWTFIKMCRLKGDPGGNPEDGGLQRRAGRTDRVRRSDSTQCLEEL